MTTKQTYWRIQHYEDPISASWRSQIGHDDDNLGKEAGTSACSSFNDLKAWAKGGHADWIGLLAIVEFEGNFVGIGMDGEPIVRPTRELQRIPIVGGRGDERISRVIQTMRVKSAKV
jgi:hypothetical protein